MFGSGLQSTNQVFFLLVALFGDRLVAVGFVGHGVHGVFHSGHFAKVRIVGGLQAVSLCTFFLQFSTQGIDDARQFEGVVAVGVVIVHVGVWLREKHGVRALPGCVVAC